MPDLASECTHYLNMIRSKSSAFLGLQQRINDCSWEQVAIGPSCPPRAMGLGPGSAHPMTPTPTPIISVSNFLIVSAILLHDVPLHVACGRRSSREFSC